MKKSIASLVVSIVTIVLLAACLVGGTVAWLMAKTKPVVNTFTYGDINVELEETDMVPGEDPETFENEYKMVPGSDLEKDPTVIVKLGSEAAWLFVKVEQAGGEVTVGEKTYTFEDFLTYEIDEGWQPLLDENGLPIEGIYFRETEPVLDEGEESEDLKLPVIKDNKVTVSEDVTKEMLNALDADADEEAGVEAKYPTLTITAYAVQKDNIPSAIEAWRLAEAEFQAETTEETVPEETAAETQPQEMP